MVFKLTTLLPQNPWWRNGNWEKDDKDLRDIDILIDRRPVDIDMKGTTILRGIRRSGKTVYLKTLIRKVMDSGIDRKDILYLSGDRNNYREIKGIVHEFFLRQGTTVLFLDEITYIPNWNALLKELHETMDITIIATGSDPVQLRQKGERLPGRGVEGNEYYFDPLSFGEHVRALRKAAGKMASGPLSKALKDLEGIPVDTYPPGQPMVDGIFPYFIPLEKMFISYLLTGGFPSVTREYVRTGRISDGSFETVVRVLLGALSKNGRSEETGREILQQLLIGMGGRTDYITIAENTGVHHTTVREYLDIMEGARMTYTIHCWDLARKHHAPRKQKKFVFQSPLLAAALHRYLSGGTWDDTMDFMDKNMEALVEATVMSHLVWSGERPQMHEQHAFAGFYYNKKECDCVLLSEKGFQGYEVKYGKVERADFPFPVTYISKDSLDKDTIPASVFLYGLEKGQWCI